MLRTERWLLFMFIIAGCGIGNLMMPSLLWNVGDNGAWLGFAFAGGLIAEACTLAIWCALGSQTRLMRLLICVSLTILGACTFSVGLQIADKSMPMEIFIVILAGAWMMFFCVEVPMSLLQRSLGWKIVLERPWSEGDGVKKSAQTSTQFGIRYLILLTTVIAILVLAVKNALPERRGFGPGFFEWVQIFFAMFAFSVFATSLSIPCVRMVLSVRDTHPWMIGTMVCLLIGPTLLMIALTIIFADAPPGEVFLYIYCFGFGAFAALVVLLLFFKCAGFVLQDGPDPMQPSKTEMSPATSDH